MLTPQERLLAPFFGRQADKPAWVADLTYWYDAAGATGRLDPRYKGQDGFKRLHEDLGVGGYYFYGVAAFETRYADLEFRVEEKSGERRLTWRIPAGALTERWTYLKGSYCWAHVEYAVKTPADLKLLPEIYARTRHVPTYAALEQQTRWLGAGGVPLAPVPRSPLPALLADWCGVETTIYALLDAPELVVQALAAIDRANDAAFAICLKAPAALFHFCDNLDSTASTPFFEEHMQAYYERRLAQLHGAGKVAVVHLDGRVRGLLPKLAACGFDGIESLTPAPIGDAAIEELRALAGNSQTILWGGIPGAMFAAPWREADLRVQTRRLLKQWEIDGRWIIGSADQIPPDGNIQLCRAVADEIERWNK